MNEYIEDIIWFAGAGLVRGDGYGEAPPSTFVDEAMDTLRGIEGDGDE